MKHLDNMSNDAIMLLNLPTGIPFVYELDENMKPVKSMEVSELPLHQIKIIKTKCYAEYVSNYDIIIFSCLFSFWATKKQLQRQWKRLLLKARQNRSNERDDSLFCDPVAYDILMYSKLY